MEDQSLRERVIYWIAGFITLEGEYAAWVAGTHVQITKASLSFLTKIWWFVVLAELKPTTKGNTLSPSLTSLVAFPMVDYPVNVCLITATEMQDRALNTRVSLHFPYLLGKLCLQANIPPNKLIDKWINAYKVTMRSKIKYVINHLFGAKFGSMGPLEQLAPHIPVNMP